MTIRKYDFASVGVDTGTAPTNTEPSASTDLATKNYVDTNALTLSGAQTISGIKSFSAPFAVAEVATPATPAAGYQKAYPKADGFWYTLDDNGIETRMGSGSGSGGINYIDNPGAETDTTGWAAYKDAVQTTPEDGTGGSPTITWTRSTSSPLRDTASFLWTKDAADRQGEGVSYAFTIDSADKSKTLKISFDVDATVDTDYASDDVLVYIYDVTNATLITPAFTQIKAAAYTFETTFVATTSTSYRLILHQSTANAAALTMKFDNFQVGPQNVVQGQPSEYGKSITLTASAGFGTLGSQAFKYDRYGRWMRLYGGMQAGTVAASVASLTFPAGFTVDTTLLQDAAGNARNPLGYYTVTAAASSALSNNFGVVHFDSDNAGILYFANNVGASSGTYDKVNGTSVLANSQYLNFDGGIWIPISEWAGSAAYLSSAYPEYLYNTTLTDASDTTAFGYGPGGSQFANFTAARTKRIRTLTPFQSTDQIFLEIWEENHWVRLESADVVKPYHTQNGVSYGMQINRITGTTTDLDVQFGTYRYSNGATFGAAGSAWSAIDNDANFKWRVVKVPGQVNVAVPSNLPSSQVLIDTPTGHGSGGTAIRTYTSANLVQTGSDITYTSDTTNGDKFTINKNGVYTIDVTDLRAAASSALGISVNSNQLTTSVESITKTHRLGMINTPSASYGSVSVTARLSAGDILRVHDDQNLTSVAAVSRVRITQIAVTQ
jgi:hypothetical protein